MKLVITALSVLCLSSPLVRAQTNADLLARMKAMEDRIQMLEGEIQQLKGGAPPAPPPVPVAVATPAEAVPQGLGGAGGAAGKALNPDVSVIGDFLGAIGNPGPRPGPSLEMHESEIGLQAVLDPYARADFFISFGEQGVNVEEGYLTFPALPGKFELRVGKMRSAFGVVNTLHNHVLPWTDRPLVSQNLVGGEDGIDDAGFSVSRIIPAPKGLFLEGTAQLFRGDSSTVFKAYKHDDVSTVEHLRAYHDLSESTNVAVGFSYARGHSPIAETLINQLYGADATVRWKPLRRSIYHSFTGRSEFIWDRNEAARGTPFGYYVSGDYQFARRWFAGGRFDRSERDESSLLRDTGGSFTLTYWPSEFSQIRAQLRRTSYAEGQTANELLFQFLFSIGAHGAHPF